MEKLQKNGWSGDNSMVFKDFSWKGQNYSAAIEIYETIGDTSSFTCHYNITD